MRDRSMSSSLGDYLKRELQQHQAANQKLEKELGVVEDEIQNMTEKKRQEELDDLKRRVHEKEANDQLSESDRRRMKRLVREHRDETEQLKKHAEKETEELIARDIEAWDPSRLPIETICRSTAMAVTLVLLRSKQGVKCHVSSTAWREAGCFNRWRECTLHLDSKAEGVLVCRFRYFNPLGCCGLVHTYKKLNMTKLADVRYGPATKGKRSVHEYLQQGRVDLMFHDQVNAQVSLQFDEQHLLSSEKQAEAVRLPPGSRWFEKMQNERIAMLLAIGFKSLHSKKWFHATPDQMTSEQQQAKAEATQVDYWMMETHRAMCKLLNVPIDEAVMAGLADGAASNPSNLKDATTKDCSLVLLSQKSPNSDFEAAARLVIGRDLWPYSRGTLLGELQSTSVCPIVVAARYPKTRGKVVALGCVCKDDLAEDLSHAAGCVAAEVRHWVTAEVAESRGFGCLVMDEVLRKAKAARIQLLYCRSSSSTKGFERAEAQLRKHGWEVWGHLKKGRGERERKVRSIDTFHLHSSSATRSDEQLRKMEYQIAALGDAFESEKSPPLPPGSRVDPLTGRVVDSLTGKPLDGTSQGNSSGSNPLSSGSGTSLGNSSYQQKVTSNSMERKMSSKNGYSSSVLASSAPANPRYR